MSAPKIINTPNEDIPMAVQLARTDILVAELIRRSDLFLMVMRYRPLADNPVTSENFRIGGDSLDLRALQGLAHGAIANIEKFIERTAGTTPEEWER